MSLQKLLWLPAALAFVALSSTAFAADKGEQGDAPHDAAWVNEKTQVCAGCHGANGVSETPNFPVIAGQYQDYLVHSLKGYRDGERGNAIMAAQAKGLSDAQIKALARFYAGKQSPLYTPKLGQ